jgi:hypothetical protein
LVLSTLLYSGQVYAKDPLSDWFADERYHIERPLAGRPGYFHEDGSPNIAQTRAFLNVVVPALHRLRPLIESGALVLTTYRGLTYSMTADAFTQPTAHATTPNR